MPTTALSRIEAAILFLTFGLLSFGIVMSNLDRFWFELYYTVEDGFIEWMTVLSLFSMLIVTIGRLVRLAPYRSSWFLITLGVFAGLCFFAIGEELSWGQRMLHTKSSLFFKLHNSQKETNIHNLVIGGKSINLIVFSRLLILVMAGYLLVLPWAFRRSSKFRAAVNQLGIPVPRVYQVVALFAVFGLISLCPSGKRAELLEFGTCFLLLAVILYPGNPEIFKSKTLSS